MALLWVDGFEGYEGLSSSSLEDEILYRYPSGYLTNQSLQTGRFGSGKCLQGGSSGDVQTLITPELTMSNVAYCGCAVMYPNFPSGTGFALLSVWNSLNRQFGIWVNNEGRLHVRTGETTLASSDFYFNSNRWYYVELGVKVATSGWYEVRVDGDVVLEGTGDTDDDGTATINQFSVDWDDIVSGHARIDDIYLCDDTGSVNHFLGDIRVDSYFPIESKLDFTPSDYGTISEWFDGEDLTTGTITSWGNTDADSGEEPEVSSGDFAITSKKAASFSSGDVLRGDSVNAFTDEFTAVIVFKQTTTTGTQVLFQENFNDTDLVGFLESNGNFTFRIGATLYETQPIVQDEVHIGIVRYGYEGLEIWFDGELVETDSEPPTWAAYVASNDTLMIGSGLDGSNLPEETFLGLISQVGVYDSWVEDISTLFQHLNLIYKSGRSTSSSTDFIPVSGSNYENVDERTPDGDTTYVESTTDGERDLLDFEINGNHSKVFGVQIFTICKSSSEDIIIVVDRDGTVLISVPITPETTYEDAYHLIEANLEFDFTDFGTPSEWFDGDDLGTGNISTWTGHNIDIVAQTGEEPSVSTGEFGNQKSVFFDHTNLEWLGNQDSGGVLIEKDQVTAVCVFKQVDATGDQILFREIVVGASVFGYLWINNGIIEFVFDGGTTAVGSSISLNTVHVAVVRFDKTENVVELWLDNELVGSNTVSATSDTGTYDFHVGTVASGGTPNSNFMFRGHIAQIGVYDLYMDDDTLKQLSKRLLYVFKDGTQEGLNSDSEINASKVGYECSVP